MSIDLDVFVIFDENDNRFPRETVERAFASMGRDAKDMKNTSFPLYRDGEQSAAYVYLPEGDLIQSFSINRPPGYEYFPEFWDAVYEVMRQTRTFCFSPEEGEDAMCCVANPDVIDKVPAEMVEKRAACLVSSGV